jgi:7-cyano-7-deazaguanine synthase
MLNDKALVLFSGGQDSATCLPWALSNFGHVETVGFDYGQRHVVELEVRKDFLRELLIQFPRWKAKLGEDFQLDLTALKGISSTSLTQEIAFEYEQTGLPNTFVPGRNLIFLSFAAALAYRRGVRHIVLGVCETDYSGYPDCRDDTIKAMQVALNLGLEKRFVLHTPLMWVDKAQTWQMAEELGGHRLTQLIKTHTHSCYQGEREMLHEWGYGCETCPACELRAKGFMTYKGVVQK